jgi:predicted amidohydrolase
LLSRGFPFYIHTFYRIKRSVNPTFEKDIFEPIVKVRAMENTVNFVYTNLVCKEGETEYWGGGCIIGAGDKESKVPGTPIVCKLLMKGNASQLEI